MSHSIFERPLTRRHVLGIGLAAAVTLLPGCGSGANESSWTFVDDRKHEVRLSRTPTRIVAYNTAAAALYDWGVTPVGVFGTEPREDPALARLPWDKVQTVGSVYGEVDPEKLRSLKADLIVSRWYPPPADAPLFGFKDLAQQRMIGAQVPIVGINSHVIGTRQIERFGDLARALGVNTKSGKVADARAAFATAEANLSRTASRQSNLRIIAISADQDFLYVAKLADSGDLGFYADRGVPLVSGKTSDPYWDKLPWREAAKYPADGILYDKRQTVLPLSHAESIRAFAELPAVKTHQIGSWLADPPPSYQAYTSRMNQLANDIAGWSKLT